MTSSTDIFTRAKLLYDVAIHEESLSVRGLPEQRVWFTLFKNFWYSEFSVIPLVSLILSLDLMYQSPATSIIKKCLFTFLKSSKISLMGQ
mgnify:CR=1 FL=1